MSISYLSLCSLFGGLSTSVRGDFAAGKVGFSHGGLDIWNLVADPTQPLDRTLRATFVRIASAKTEGKFAVNRPIVAAFTWGSEVCHVFSKMLFVEMVVRDPTSYSCNPHPAPCTLHPTPCTLHLTPHTLHPTGGQEGFVGGGCVPATQEAQDFSGGGAAERRHRHNMRWDNLMSSPAVLTTGSLAQPGRLLGSRVGGWGHAEVSGCFDATPHGTVPPVQLFWRRRGTRSFDALT